MLGKNLRLPVKIGNRTGNFDDPVIAPGRQVQLFEYFMICHLESLDVWIALAAETRAAISAEDSPFVVAMSSLYLGRCTVT